MEKRKELLEKFYAPYDEENRLIKSFHGKLEYATTMHYIHKFAKSSNTKILEIGAGTGRYSAALAKEGYKVSDVELVSKNFNVLKKKSDKIRNLEAIQGDAVDLSFFKDNTFPLTLSLGPMYHLYEDKDVKKAIKEAIRVTKVGGIIMFAFIPIHAVMYGYYLDCNWLAGKKENFTKDYKVKHFKEQIFTGYEIEEFEKLFSKLEVSHICTASVDGSLRLVERGKDCFKMTNKEFESFANYHLHFCEKRELLGFSDHCLYICRKEK